MAADEPGGGGLADDDVNDVLAVEVADLTEEGLLAFVVVLFLVLELPGVAAVGLAGQLRADGPAGEGPGALANVHLGVVADAHGEELKELTSPVLVDGVTVVFVVVQPEDHGGVLGQLDEQVLVVSQTVLAEHVDLLQQLVTVVHLGVAGGENVVPEKRDLLFERALGADHLVHPVGLTGEGSTTGEQEAGVIPEHQRHLAALHLFGRIEQFLDSGLVALSNPSLQLLTRRPETDAAHQVGH